MSAERTNLEPQIANVLLIDVVGYSRLLVDEQVDLLKRLNQIVRQTSCSCNAEADGTLIRLPTGDGMALLFFRSPEEPLQCAVEISEALRDHPEIQVRMGAHSGPVNKIDDVNERPNVAGSGINTAQRVLDCGDAGHILLSKRLADDLADYGHWRPHLYDLGECVVKHGAKVHLFNFHNGNVGNPNRPSKLDLTKSGAEVSVGRTPRWRRFLWLGVTAACLAVLAVGGIVIFRPHPRVGVPEKSIAVLPFENLSEARENDHFADGIHDDILTGLSKFSQLKVIGRTSVLRYRDLANIDMAKTSAELGVRYFLEGSVRRDGAQFRITAMLIDSATGSQIWAEQYDRVMEDVFSLQSEIAEKIVARLQIQFTPEEQAESEDRPTTDFLAYDFYVRAKAIIARVVYDSSNPEELLEAAKLLDQAIARDPSFYLAYCQLASAHDRIYLHGVDRTPERLALAQKAVDAAVRLRPEFGETHLAIAAHYYFGYLDYARARDELAIARRKLPNDPLPVALLGYIDRREGRWPEAIQKLEHAVSLDPRNLVFLKQLALAYSCVRRYDDMRAILDRSIAIAPENPGLRVQRAGIRLDARGETLPMHRAIESALSKDTDAGRRIFDQWFLLASCEHDPAEAARALAVTPEKGCREEGIPYAKAWCEGLLARQKNDLDGAKASFLSARGDMAKIVRGEPDFAEALSGLGMIDAALGDKKNALQEGRRAVELMPSRKDAIVGPLLLQNLAMIQAWTGEKEAAIESLREVTSLPSYLSYGQLLLHPSWAPLRDEEGFKKIVASLAPNAR